jgi:hypothetical protein
MKKKIHATTLLKQVVGMMNGEHWTMPSRLRRRVFNQEPLSEFQINSTLIWQIMGPVILGIFALLL